jgi:SLT domain-containing protein
VSHINDPFGRVAELPGAADAGDAQADRVRRLRWIAEAAEALIDGRPPSRPAALFLASALRGWLADGRARGGDLEKRFLRVAAPPRSTVTPSRLWQREVSGAREQDSPMPDTITTFNHEE